MRRLFKHIGPGWLRLHIVLSVLICGGGSLLVYVSTGYDEGDILVLGVPIYWVLAIAIHWVIDGFKKKPQDSNLKPEEKPSATPEPNTSQARAKNRKRIGVILFFVFWVIIGAIRGDTLKTAVSPLLDYHNGEKRIYTEFTSVYIDYESVFLGKNVKVDDAIKEVINEYAKLKGLHAEMLDFCTTSRGILSRELNSGEIEKRQYIEEIEKLNNKYLGYTFSAFLMEKGSGIVKNHMGEIDEDSDFAEAYTDKLWYVYGLDTDLDGDGIYNAQTWTGIDNEFLFMGILSKSALESADAELYFMITGLESLAEHAMDFVLESVGSDYAGRDYFENQKAYINKRYVAENEDKTLVIMSMPDALGNGDLTAVFTHLANALGTGLPWAVLLGLPLTLLIKKYVGRGKRQ